MLLWMLLLLYVPAASHTFLFIRPALINSVLFPVREQ